MSKLKLKIYEIIFEADTRTGKAFDISLLILILLSIVSVVLESVESINKQFGNVFMFIEIFSTIFFTVEYLLRIFSVPKPQRYIFSFMGLIDLLSFGPSLFGLFIGRGGNFLFLRIFRLLRIFRVLKLSRYLSEEENLLNSLKKSVERISVFLLLVSIVVLILASIMYLVESKESGFTSIPQSIYWTIVTLTTVGYGDITPITPLGKVISSIIMLLGYAIIAIPTGIITSEMIFKRKNQITSQVCPACLKEGHDHDAEHCKYCGAQL